MFIGFAIGTLCLIGLVRAVARRRGGYGFYPHAFAYGYGGHGFGRHRHGCGPMGFGGHHHHRNRSWHEDVLDDDGPSWRGNGGPSCNRGRGVVFSILEKLDASPAQEKVIITAIDELKGIAKEMRGIGREVRSDVARAVRGPLLDDVALEGATARIDDATLKLRAAARAAIAKIHEALDDRQRKMLGDMIDSSFGGRW
ncbi:MAG: periplasmic heavy metal sensor [Polyangiaceae bacterium]